MPREEVVIVNGARTPMTEWVGGRARRSKLPPRRSPQGPLSPRALGARANRRPPPAPRPPRPVRPPVVGGPSGRIGHRSRSARGEAALGRPALPARLGWNALQTSGDAIYGARHVALKAGVPISVPALTVNRLCGSGIQSVVTAAS